MDIKLKSAEELYMQYHRNPYSSSPDIVVKNMLKAIREAQRNAIEVEVQKCSEEADADVCFHGWLAKESMKSGEPFEEGEDYEVYVINSSILDCKRKLFEENNL